MLAWINGFSLHCPGVGAALLSPAVPGSVFSSTSQQSVLSFSVISQCRVHFGASQQRQPKVEEATMGTQPSMPAALGFWGSPEGQQHLLVLRAMTGIAAWSGHRL